MKKLKYLTIREVFDYEESGGIFEHMLSTFEWLTQDIADLLDGEYFLNHSGAKFCSPLVVSAAEKSSIPLPSSSTEMLAGLVAIKFKPKWDRLWEAFTAEYNPIHNYNMEEQTSIASTNSRSKSGSVNNTNTKGTTSTGSQENRTFGFNTDSETGSPSSLSTVTSGDTVNESLAEISSESVNGTDSENQIVTKKGNIGVTTTQQMLTAEIELRQWIFFDTILSDVDDFLTIPMYDPCQL